MPGIKGHFYIRWEYCCCNELPISGRSDLWESMGQQSGNRSRDVVSSMVCSMDGTDLSSSACGCFLPKNWYIQKAPPCHGSGAFLHLWNSNHYEKPEKRRARRQIPWRNCPIHRRTLSSGFHIAPAIDSNLSSRPERILKTQNASNGLETRSSYVFIYARWLAAGSGTGYFFVATPQAFSMLSSVFYYTWGEGKWE